MSGVGLRWHLDSRSLRRADSQPAVGGFGEAVLWSAWWGVHDIHTKKKMKKKHNNIKTNLAVHYFYRECVISTRGLVLHLL